METDVTMKRISLAVVVGCLIGASVAMAHTSKGTLVCPNTATPQLQASITGDSFPFGHHVSVSLKVVDLGSTIFDQVVVADSPNGNQTFGPFLVNRTTTNTANATATFTIRDLTEQKNYIGTGAFAGKCGEVPSVVPPTPPVPPVVPPVVPPAPPVPPTVIPPAVTPPVNKPPVKKHKRLVCKYGRRAVKDSKGHRAIICKPRPKPIYVHPHFTG